MDGTSSPAGAPAWSSTSPAGSPGWSRLGRLDEAARWRWTRPTPSCAPSASGSPQPLAIEAAGRLALARGDDPATVADLFGRAVALATEQGGHGVAGRVRATAARLGVELPG